MLIHSKSELKQILKDRIKDSIAKTQNEIYMIINRFVKEYYAEFDPERYERTYQLYCSLVKSDLIETKNGWKSEIYFDIDRLDYYFKLVNGKPKRNRGWTAAKTLKAAMTSKHPHGGYLNFGGTPIWIEAMKVIDREKVNILKRMMRDSGIPIK